MVLLSLATSPNRWIERDWIGSLDSAAGVQCRCSPSTKGARSWLIADVRRGGHNEHTHEQETLLLQNLDFIASCGAAVVLAIQNEWGPPRRRFRATACACPIGSKDDLFDAFRQLPVISAHRPLNTIMWYDTRARAYRFAVVKGMVFGRSSAVNAFCRFPTFAVARERHVGTVLGYVDESSQFKWSSVSSLRASSLSVPHSCLEPSLASTKPDGQPRKQAVRVCVCASMT